MIKLINNPAMPKEVKTYGCNPGNKKRPLYKYVYDEKYGCPRRVLNGYMDVQDFIQQSVDDVDFKAIGKMLVDNRDNVISHFEGDDRIIDTTLQPRNVHEFQALHNKMKASFEGLPDDIKALFGNDFQTFAKAYQSGTMKQTFDTYAAAQGQAAGDPAPDGGTDK